MPGREQALTPEGMKESYCDWEEEAANVVLSSNQICALTIYFLSFVLMLLNLKNIAINV